MVTIRPLTPDDFASVFAINQAAVPAVGEVSEDALRALIELASIALVAEIDGAVAGFCVLLAPDTTYGSVNYLWFMDRREQFDDFIYLDRVAVAESQRDRGIGSQLYDEVEGRTTARWLTLEVNLDPPNPGSMRFHERRGFERVGEQDTTYGTRVAMLARRLR